MSNTLLTIKPRKRISLTPLIDVVFILLMFFMLTSTFNQWKAIDLVSGAASETPLAINSDSPPQLLILHQDGLLSLKGGPSSKVGALEHVGVETVAPALALDKTVVVFPEPQANVQTIIATLEQLKAVGVQTITLGNSVPNTEVPKDASVIAKQSKNLQVSL
ncbi:MAG: biopolymer transporter ExbD [Spongiibacteraceae bacterium]